MTTVLARTSGICPLCSKYIAKNRSKIVALPEAITPRGDGRQSADDGRWYNADGAPINMRPRQWAHAACAKRYGTEPRYQGQLDSDRYPELEKYRPGTVEPVYSGRYGNVYRVRDLVGGDR